MHLRGSENQISVGRSASQTTNHKQKAQSMAFSRSMSMSKKSFKPGQEKSVAENSAYDLTNKKDEWTGYETTTVATVLRQPVVKFERN